MLGENVVDVGFVLANLFGTQTFDGVWVNEPFVTLVQKIVGFLAGLVTGRLVVRNPLSHLFHHLEINLKYLNLLQLCHKKF